MKYVIYETRQYRKAIRKLSHSKNFKLEELNKVVNVLARGERLEKKYQDHKLSGVLKGFRECHVAFDVLLVYKHEEDKCALVLINAGSHSDLFGR